MGILLTETFETPFGFLFNQCYINIVKKCDDRGILITESVFSDKAMIQATIDFYKDKEARQLLKQPIQKEKICCLIPYTELGNPFVHIYDEIKRRYVGAIDDV